MIDSTDRAYYTAACPYGAPCLGDISVAEVGEALQAQLAWIQIARTLSDAAVHAC